MGADARILNIFLQRHVAHDAHGAEAFRCVLGGTVDRFRGEHGGDGGERQIGKACVREGVRMVGRPRCLPDGGTRDFKPDRDFGELCADRLMLDDRTPALHAQFRIVECGLVGGASDAETWICAEFEFKGDSNEFRVWWDDVARTALSSGPSKHAGFVMPTFNKLWFGWWMYNMTEPQAPCCQRGLLSLTLKPGASRGTSSVAAAPPSPTLARTANSAAIEAPTTRSLRPWMIHSSPERTAAVENRGSLACGR